MAQGGGGHLPGPEHQDSASNTAPLHHLVLSKPDGFPSKSRDKIVNVNESFLPFFCPSHSFSFSPSFCLSLLSPFHSRVPPLLPLLRHSFYSSPAFCLSPSSSSLSSFHICSLVLSSEHRIITHFILASCGAEGMRQGQSN